jgi:gamma-glutamyl:cysteine ligase YbdK (ATP-grasp superfamily)
MGDTVDRETYDEADHLRFADRLDRSLVALRELLRRPGFGVGRTTIGAELELSLVDENGQPLPINQAVRDTLPQVALEIGRFNVELNLRPQRLAERPFVAFRDELQNELDRLRKAVASHHGRVLAIGTLPTLREDGLGVETLSDDSRYRALDAAVRQLRGRPLALQVAGVDRLTTQLAHVTAEAANTSWQIHLRVSPDRFVAVYNAAQLATAPVLAASVNSPFLFGHQLWDETRIALFEQITDDRAAHEAGDTARHRVGFGDDWLRGDATDLFERAVRQYPSMLPILSDDDPVEEVTRGEVPALSELRLHLGTVWWWNRPVYDPAGGGHLRVELRALPSGPSVPDMLANAAFLLGLTLASAHDPPRLPFAEARRGFYAAARDGLDAELTWPFPDPITMPARELVPRLLPEARRGLDEAGVDSALADELLDLIAARVAAGQTGSAWQRRAFDILERRRGDRDAALIALVDHYHAASWSGRPVHTWPDP